MTALTERDLTPSPIRFVTITKMSKLNSMCRITDDCTNPREGTTDGCASCNAAQRKAERNALKAASKPAPAPLKRSTRIAKKAAPESLAGLKIEAQKVFNAFIRERDKDLPCIYCSKPVNSQDLEACHFYPVSTSESLRYFEGNVFGGHRLCNMQDDRGAIETNVLNRIGEEEFTNIQRLKSSYAKFSAETLEMIIENYTKPKETI